MSLNAVIASLSQEIKDTGSIEDLVCLLERKKKELSAQVEPKKISLPLKLEATEELKDFVIRPNNYVPPHKEVEGDVFDRQRVMIGFDQAKLENEVVFCIGTGGLGQSVQLAVCRLGAKKLIILDMDEYDPSNLNRQILGGLQSGGKRKVDVAEAGLALHNLRTQIVKVHCDAVTRWDLIVQHARESTVVFNCIDYGAVMDMAINSLCKRLAIPYVSGSTYANTLIVNFFNGRQGQACWSCLNSVTESFIDNAMCKSDLEAYLRAEEDKKQQQQQQQKTTMTMTTATETHIISQTDRSSTKTDTRASAQAGEVHPGAASGSAATDAGAADVADAAAELYSNVSLNTLSGYLRDRCEMTEADAEIEAALRALQQKMSVNSNSNCKRKEQAHGRREGSTAAAVMVAGESGEKEGQKAEERGGQEEEKKGKREEVVLPSTSDLSALLKLLKVEISAKLLPSLILSYDNLNFIPKDLHFPTRNVGSWVCVCSGGALQMVNAWVQDSICGNPFPNWSQMSLHDFTAANSIRRDKDDYDTRLDLGSDKFCEVCKDRWQEQ